MARNQFNREYNPEVWEVPFTEKHINEVLSSEYDPYEYYPISGKSDSRKLDDDIYYFGKKKTG